MPDLSFSNFKYIVICIVICILHSLLKIAISKALMLIRIMVCMSYEGETGNYSVSFNIGISGIMCIYVSNYRKISGDVAPWPILSLDIKRHNLPRSVAPDKINLRLWSSLLSYDRIMDYEDESLYSSYTFHFSCSSAKSLIINIRMEINIFDKDESVISLVTNYLVFILLLVTILIL